MPYRNEGPALARGRPRDGALDRRIANVVLELLAVRGYEGVTFEAVARRCQNIADRERGAQLTMPVAVISQDWGSQLGFDASALWRAWAPDFTYQATTSGHYMAEANPDEIADFVQALARRSSLHH